MSEAIKNMQSSSVEMEFAFKLNPLLIIIIIMLVPQAILVLLQKVVVRHLVCLLMLKVMQLLH